MGYAMAGLLSGLGRGIENLGKSIEERRAAALEAARREASEQRVLETRKAERAEDRAFKVEDQATEHTQSLERIDKTQKGAVEVLETRNAHDSKESAKDRAFKMAEQRLQQGHETNLTRLRSSLDAAKTKDELRLRAAIDGGQVQDSYTTEDGKLAIIYKSGRREITDDPGSRQSSAASTAGLDPVTGLPVATPTAAAPAARTPAAPVDNTKQQAAAMSALAMAYQAARKDPKGMRTRYPALFNADGTLKSMEEAKNMVRSRYAS